MIHRATPDGRPTRCNFLGVIPKRSADVSGGLPRTRVYPEKHGIIFRRFSRNRCPIAGKRPKNTRAPGYSATARRGAAGGRTVVSFFRDSRQTRRRVKENVVEREISPLSRQRAGVWYILWSGGHKALKVRQAPPRGFAGLILATYI